MADPFINPGERAIVAGRTGSGKSTLGKWLLLRSPGHWVIINPKWTKAFDKLPDSEIIKGINLKKIDKSINENRFTIINPNANESDPETLDLLIKYFHEAYTDIGICVDESYAIHTNGRAGPGLIGLLTRGRELKQSFLGLTQRPAFLSKFLFSEAEYIVGMALSMEDDRKRMFEFTGKQIFKDKLPAHEFLWYDVGNDNLRHFNPVPVD